MYRSKVLHYGFHHSLGKLHFTLDLWLTRPAVQFYFIALKINLSFVFGDYD